MPGFSIVFLGVYTAGFLVFLLFIRGGVRRIRTRNQYRLINFNTLILPAGPATGASMLITGVLGIALMIAGVTHLLHYMPEFWGL
jgi:hypothetical protein